MVINNTTDNTYTLVIHTVQGSQFNDSNVFFFHSAVNNQRFNALFIVIEELSKNLRSSREVLNNSEWNFTWHVWFYDAFFQWRSICEKNYLYVKDFYLAFTSIFMILQTLFLPWRFSPLPRNVVGCSKRSFWFILYSNWLVCWKYLCFPVCQFSCSMIWSLVLW